MPTPVTSRIGTPDAPLELSPRMPFAEGTIELLSSALTTGSLSSVNGPLTTRLESEFAAFYGSRHAIATASGTAAIHTAIAALRLEPGSEVIVSPITDAGSIVPVLYEGLIPTFCDVDVRLATTSEAVRAAITDRTRAVLVVHLFGGVSDTRALRELADAHGLWLIEDCSQAHATRCEGPKSAEGDRAYVGTLGHIGVFSMQQSKHMTTGDGGLCITNDATLAERMRLFRDKGWDRQCTQARAYPHLGLNYRITELQAAVALPQIARLPRVVQRRHAIAAELTQQLRSVPGVETWEPPTHGPASYWCYPFFVDADRRDHVTKALRERGVPATAGYIGAPIFECLAATDTQRTFGASRYPFTLAPPDFSYADIRVPHTRAALDRIIVVWIHEDLTDDDVDAIGATIVTVVA